MTVKPREFLFTYRWNGEEYGMTVAAYSEAEARGRVAQMSLARFDGVVTATVPITPRGIFARIRAALTPGSGGE